MRGVVQPVLIQDERLGEGADFEEPMPVGGVARQARDFQTHHESRASQAHVADQLLKSFAVRRRCARVTEVPVDHDDLLDRPAEGRGALSERILTRGALGILDDLPQRRLPHIEIRLATQVAWGDLL
jgi:hypothetical protein